MMTTRNANNQLQIGRPATPSRNGLAGWPAFRASRQQPAPIPSRRHGNWKHGRYTKDRRDSARLFRALCGVLNGRGDQLDGWTPPRWKPSGWLVYWASR